jgi:hypothetical protein
MVVLELEVDDELAAALADEAEQFEFESTTAYLHWLVRNRSVVFDQPDDALEERLAAIERRLDELEGSEQAPGPDPETESNLDAERDHDLEGSDEVMDAVDEVFEETAGADDEEISEAIASIEIEEEPTD